MKVSFEKKVADMKRAEVVDFGGDRGPTIGEFNSSGRYAGLGSLVVTLARAAGREMFDLRRREVCSGSLAVGALFGGALALAFAGMFAWWLWIIAALLGFTAKLKYNDLKCR